MLSVVIRAFIPGKDFDYDKGKEYKDPTIKMMLPLTIFAIVIFIFGMYSQPFVDFFAQVAGI